MSRRTAPLHRVWLHLLEDDPAVPSGVMQLARVYADFASESKGREPFFVTWATLKRCTHMSNDKCNRALTWLRERGWLEPLEPPEGVHKQRVYHRLTVPDDLPEHSDRRRGLHAV